MTLCLAWKQGKNIFFASDSRLSKPPPILPNSSPVTNDANKVFKIRAEFYNSLPERFSGIPAKATRQATYGLCFAGSYLNGSILADTLDDFLSNLLVNQNSDISIDNISQIAFAIYKQVSRQFIKLNGNDIKCEVLFGGYCLNKGAFKLYKFSPKEAPKYEDISEYLKEEINLDAQTILLGDKIAKQKAEELLNKINADYTHYHLLREIIKDENIPTVGGNIQIGYFDIDKFTTHGIVEHSSFEDDNGNLQIKDIYKLRGLVLDFQDKELLSGKLQIHKPFFSPFSKEKDELIRRQGQNG